MPAPLILWFRRDLRLSDNPALAAAAATGDPVVPVFILDEVSNGVRPLGSASRWWLHHSLASLANGVSDLGSPLVLRRGPADAVLQQLIEETGAKGVFWNRLYDAASVDRDTRIKQDLQGSGRIAESFNGSLLHEPWTIKTKTGKPYSVFTPFWKAILALGDPGATEQTPEQMKAPDNPVDSDTLDDWNLLPTNPDWAGGLRDMWKPGEQTAQIQLRTFHDTALPDYGDGRDIPGANGTSMMSPHLHFGEISPRQIWRATRFWADAKELSAASGTAQAYLREIGWREFNQHLQFHFPNLPMQNVNQRFDAFPWVDDADALAAWQRGRTGYPIVDAGMRELWETGWMHNRVRMVVASFLVKHLRIHWRQGEDWFWDTLVDADPANNAGNWQWVAGCGFDAAPYFRIFNPILQGERFDTDGRYVRRWVPEIADLPDKYLHKPWEAPAALLEEAGIRLGDTYPSPIVDHKAARQTALDAYGALKNAAS